MDKDGERGILQEARFGCYPSVSAIISTYNRAEFFLPRALDSVLEQDFDDFELIVVDDHSTDDTLECVQAYHDDFLQKGVSLRFCSLPFNSGYQCKPKNVGINASWGDYIAYLDDDNVWKPNHLSELYQAIVKDQVDMVYGLREYKNYNVSDEFAKEKGLYLGVSYAPMKRDFNPREIAKGNFIDTSDIMHSKGSILYVLEHTNWMWDETKRRFADWNLVYRYATLQLSARCVPKVLTEYWWHKDQLQLTRPPVEIPLQMDYFAYQEAKCQK